MSESTLVLDPRRLLESAWVYRTAQALIRGDASYRRIANEYLRAKPGDRVLDIGCGPAEILCHLPEVDYLGFDASPKYIEWARKRHGARGRFLCQDLDNARLETLGEGSFDLIIAYGLVHHLDDDEALDFFALARSAMRPLGRLITIDGCYASGQSKFVRWLLERDRGKYVRDAEAYRALAHSSFGNVSDRIHHDLYRMPYTLIVFECAV